MLSTSRRGAAIDGVDRDDRLREERSVRTAEQNPTGEKERLRYLRSLLNDPPKFTLPINNFVE